MIRSYRCIMCKRIFGRKWNAFRHNTTVHSDLSKIVLISANSHRFPNHPKGTRNSHTKNFTKFKKFESAQKSDDGFDYLDNLIFAEQNEIESKIMKIIGQMIKPYRELETSLNYLVPHERAKILTMAFSSSLLSSNPVKSLHEIAEVYRSSLGLEIIAKNW